MDRSEYASALNNIINLYSDLTIRGEAREHEDYDFSSYNVYEEFLPEEKKNSDIKPETEIVMEKKSQSSVKVGGNKTSVMIDLSLEINKCKKCPLGAKARVRIPGKGLVNTNIFVIANPVTQNEEKENYPLSGDERNFFYKWLSAINLDPDKLFITNILKCNWRTDQLKIDHIEACREFLDKQIDIVNPSIIITLGQLPLSSLKRAPADIMTEHGKVINYRGYKVFPIFEPGMVLKNQTLKAVVWSDLKVLKNIIDNG